MKQLVTEVNTPKSFIMTINAGYIAPDHWTQDVSVGGGRVLGEACHFIDLMRFLANSRIASVQSSAMGQNGEEKSPKDTLSITLGFEDGSLGTILYLANGSSRFPKERIEVFADGKILQLDNYRKLKGFGWNGFRKMNLFSQNKGQQDCAKRFINSLKKGTCLIPLKRSLKSRAFQ